jgi:hypothetical protein
LSTLVDGLVDNKSRLSLTPATLESSAFSDETPQVSDEELKIRDMLIEKMEEHEAWTQLLRGTKKQTTSTPQGFEKPLLFEADKCDIMLDDATNDNTPGSQEAEIWNDDNLEVTSTGCEPSTEHYQQLTPNTAVTNDTPEGYRFSRLVPERAFASPVLRMVGEHGGIFCHGILHGDPECRKDRGAVNEAVSALESQKTSDNHELKDASFTAYARPPSPEFDFELPQPRASPSGNITAEYSLISEADDYLREKGDTDCADEDGGFLSVLSEVAAYHASLKPSVRDDSAKLTENVATCSECSEDAPHCGRGSVCKEHDGMETHLEPLPLREASSEFREERRGQKECREGDLQKIGTNDDSDSSQESCVVDSSVGSHMESWGREMDASSDLNDSDRKKIEELHDTLEEVELMLKFGMDYMMSTNDEHCSEPSAPCKPLRDLSEFEDFGDAVDEIESHRRLADGTETSCEDRDAVETRVSSVSDQNCAPPSHDGKTASLSEADENGFVKLQTASVKLQTASVRKPHSKLQTVAASLTVKGHRPSPFKTPGKPALPGTPFQKLLPPRSAKKSPLKPVVTPSLSRRPANYREIVSPVGAYIHNTPTPSLVTIVKPKLLHAATPKGTMACRGATAAERQECVSVIENTPLKVGTTCMRLTVRISCSSPRLWLLSPVNITVHNA